MDLFNAYYKLFSSTKNEEVVWWYCGAVTEDVDGLGKILSAQAETIMVFKTENPAPDTIKITWKEIGYFRDIGTGEIQNSWFNPFTGVTSVTPKSFEDGPAIYTIKRQGEGLDISLDQSHAVIDKVKLQVKIANGQIGMIQDEDKKRTYERADGTWPEVDSPEATSIRTTLAIYGSMAEIENPAVSNASAYGFYESGGSGKDSGAWSRKIVRGIMKKGAVDQKFNPTAWERLKQLYPHYFKGERISPNWD